MRKNLFTYYKYRVFDTQEVFMWDTIKVIIGLLIMCVIGVIIFGIATLTKPVNPAEVAEGLPAVPVFVVVGLVALLIWDIKSGR